MAFLQAHTGRAASSISPAQTLASFDMDSLDYVEFVMELEDELGTEAKELTAKPVDTVGDLIDVVKAMRR